MAKVANDGGEIDDEKKIRGIARGGLLYLCDERDRESTEIARVFFFPLYTKRKDHSGIYVVKYLETGCPYYGDFFSTRILFEKTLNSDLYRTGSGSGSSTRIGILVGSGIGSI